MKSELWIKRCMKSMRNRLLYDFKCSHPELSFAEIATIFSITRSRAHQLYHEEKNRGETQGTLNLT